MGKVENAVVWAIGIANDNSHGYDQNNRMGPVDYDCSGFVITAFEQAGFLVKENGASYTGNIKNAFLATGFANVTSTVNLTNTDGMKRGDVLLKEGSHVAIYLGNGQIVHASINEKGTITGGKPGDQTGKEICVRSYYNEPWNVVLRYNESYLVEVGVFKVRSDAEKCGNFFQSNGFTKATSLVTVPNFFDGYIVQVGIFSNINDANALVEILKNRGYASASVNKSNVVEIGIFNNKSDADVCGDFLQSKGYTHSTSLVVVPNYYEGYVIQVGLFTVEQEAINLVNKAKTNGYPSASYKAV